MRSTLSAHIIVLLINVIQRFDTHFLLFTAAYKDADGKRVDGRRIVVDVERGRTVKDWRPRRLGTCIHITIVVVLAGTNVLCTQAGVLVAHDWAART